jgi:hypothetical protein
MCITNCRKVQTSLDECSDVLLCFVVTIHLLRGERRKKDFAESDDDGFVIVSFFPCCRWQLFIRLSSDRCLLSPSSVVCVSS